MSHIAKSLFYNLTGELHLVLYTQLTCQASVLRDMLNFGGSLFFRGTLALVGNTLTEEQTAVIIDETLETPQVTPQVKKLLQILEGEMDRDQLQTALKLRARKNFRLGCLAPALADKLIEMTIPDKPNSRLQKYRLTSKGQSIRRNES